LFRVSDNPAVHKNELDIGCALPELLDCLIGGTLIPASRSLHVGKFDCDDSFNRAFPLKQLEGSVCSEMFRTGAFGT